MPPKKPLAHQAEPSPRRRGRPDQGIRSGYKRVEVAFPPSVYEGITRLADRRQVETGRTTRRADIVRQAVIEYLREHLPEGGPY
jgi:hypothetical protein